MDSEYRKINNDIIRRYSKRLDHYGYNVKTLGWGSTDQQEYRFRQFSRLFENSKNKTITDYGCGFGDFYFHLKRNKINFKKYIGVDINPNLIQEAKKRNVDEKDADFLISSLNEKLINLPISNIGVMIGVLNLNFEKKISNMNFSKNLISNAFENVDEMLIVDFLSSYTTPLYPKEEFVYYHDPAEMLEFGLTICENVELYHNYQPIPQREFILCLKKK